MTTFVDAPEEPIRPSLTSPGSRRVWSCWARWPVPAIRTPRPSSAGPTGRRCSSPGCSTPCWSRSTASATSRRSPHALSEAIGKTAAPEDVDYLLEKKLRPLGLLEGADGSAPVAPKANPLLALKPRVAVSNPDVTRG